MTAYDFSSLSPHDFELLARDLLQAELGCRVESFKSGRDKGIDLRYAVEDRQHTIVQCKHYVRTGFAGLKSSLANEEKAKIDKLNPASYRLVTSVPLSPQNKDTLMVVLAPHVRGAEDILGCEDLNNLLGRHPDIERKHFKLWIGSTNVLQMIVANDVFSRSYIDAADVKRRLSLFVPTPAVDRARQILAGHGFCLISGIPGIGKTTTAEMLVAMALEAGWEVNHLASVGDAFRTLKADARQLFFYDDFLGQTSFRDNSLRKNEDRDVVRLLQYCARHKGTKQVLLTTREYLLAQAKQNHEVLYRTPVDLARCIVSLEDYTSQIRAEILINHLFFYDVSEPIRHHIVRSGTAKRIVAHKNYSPRIVEWMCESSLRGTTEPTEFAKVFLQSLDDPSELWHHAFENQLSAAARELILGVATLGDRCDTDALLTAVLAYRGVAEPRHEDLLALRKGLAELEGNFVRIDADGSKSAVRFHNPSVKDFTDKLFAQELTTARAFFASARFFEQVTMVLSVVGTRNACIDDDLFCRKVAETHRAPSPKLSPVQVSGRRALLLPPGVSVSRRLESALELAKTRSRGAHERVVRLAMAFIGEPDESIDNASDVIDLYRTVRRLTTDLGLAFSVTRRDLVQSLRDAMREIEDFANAQALLESPEDDDVLEELAGAFLDFAVVDLEHVVSNARSSTDLESHITALERAMGEFGLEGSVNLDEARAALDELSAKEDYYADMHKEDYHEQRHAERVESETVDEILGSLLD